MVCSCPHLGVHTCGCAGPGVSQVVKAKVSPHLHFALGHPGRALEQSEMAATCAGLERSQAKPSCESRLLVPSLGLTEASCYLFERIYGVVKHEPRPVINIEKQFRWA